MRRIVVLALLCASTMTAPAGAELHGGCGVHQHRGYLVHSILHENLNCHDATLTAYHVIEHGIGGLQHYTWRISHHRGISTYWGTRQMRDSHYRVFTVQVRFALEPASG